VSDKLREVSQSELNAMLATHAEYLRTGLGPKVNFEHLLIKGLTIPEGSDFRRMDLSFTRFENTTFNLVMFSYIDFAGARFDDVQFQKCLFSNVEFSNSTWRHINFENCLFDFCFFRGAKNFQFCDFGGAHLQDCDLTGVDIQFCKRFVLDNTVTPGMRLPLRSPDPWSQLVRSYTGAKLLFNFLFLAVYFTPFVVKGLGLIALSRMEARLSERLAAVAQKVAEKIAEHPLEIQQALGPMLLEIQKVLDPCATYSCEPIPVWRVLLGHDLSWWWFWLGIVLLAYNVARAFLTWRIAPLKEEEVVSGRSPYFLPRWEMNHVWQTIRRRDWARLKLYAEELWHAYGPLWWMHRVIKYAFFAVIVLSLWNLIGFFGETVYLPVPR
jgi:hypothetical protein